MTFGIFYRLAPLLALPVLLLTACTGEDPTLTGSSEATVLTGSTFTVTERSVSGGKLVLKGTVKNTGKTWYPTWIVEGDFYADSTFAFKLGGATQSISYSLEKGASTGFELRFSSTQYTAANYPNFAAKNFRVIQGTLR